MHERIFRGCRRSLSMWREAIGRYRRPSEQESERVKSRRAKKQGLRRFFDRD